jgi:hypothetical protein
MMRIFNELKEAEWLLEHGFRRGFLKSEIGLIAKYYRYIGLEENEISNKTFEFCKKFALGYNEILDDPVVEQQIQKSKKYKLRVPIDINITENELKIIKELHNYRYEKVLFTMLVVAKYEKLTNEKNESKEYYINKKPLEIYRLSHTSKKKNENIINILYKKDLIDDKSNIIKYNDNNIKFLLKFTTTEDISKNVILITDINNIIKFYPPYCEVCGKDIEKNSNSHKLCKDCYKKKEHDRLLETMRKKRGYYANVTQ